MSELFESQPYFNEDLIKYSNCPVDPNEDPLLVSQKVIMQKWPDQYFKFCDRLKQDEQEISNYWLQIE